MNGCASWIQKALSGWHAVDFAHYNLQASQIFFLKPQQVHFLQVEAPEGYVLQFGQEHLCHLGISDQYLQQLNLFVRLPDSPYLQLTQAESALLEPLLQNLASELQTPQLELHQEMAATWLKLFLLACARIKADHPQRLTCSLFF